jgi:MFS transporter, DHA1 family, multidrug resistance protein
MPASAFIRDTAFGQIVRLATRNRWPQYPEERDRDSWRKFVNERKSGNLARYGTVNRPDGADDEAKANPEDPESPHLGSSRPSEVGLSDDEGKDGQKEGWDSDAPTETHNAASGHKVDPNVGRDVQLVDWLENDPEVQ